MNKELAVDHQVTYQAIGGEISHELAAKMVKEHNDKNSVENSYSYVIGKNIIEQVFAQPGCVGVRFFDAINEAGEKTLVFVGIDSKGKSIIEITTVNGHGKLAVTPGMLNDQILAPHPINWFSL
jgi:hypothetical protein